VVEPWKESREDGPFIGPNLTLTIQSLWNWTEKGENKQIIIWICEMRFLCA